MLNCVSFNDSERTEESNSYAIECINLNTADEILEAFERCNHPREEIALFQNLVTRADAPIEAFIELLKTNQQEPVLALTIQAFGQITNPELNKQLKQSIHLLEILSQQARSLSSDLIRWAAATTIERVEFDFISVSPYLTEKIRKIAEKIMQSQVNRFADPTLINSVDYQEFVHFWVYGAFDKLREISRGYDFWELWEEWQVKIERGWQDSCDEREIERLNKFSVCWDVMNAIDFEGMPKQIKKYQEFQDKIHQIKSVNSQLYEIIYSREKPQIRHLLLDDMDKLIFDEISNLRIIANEFYSPNLKYTSNVSDSLRIKIKKLKTIGFTLTLGMIFFAVIFVLIFFIFNWLDFALKIPFLAAVLAAHLIALTVLFHNIKENKKKLDTLSKDMDKFYKEINQLTKILWE